MSTMEKVTVLLGRGVDNGLGAWAGITDRLGQRGFVAFPSTILANALEETGRDLTFHHKWAAGGPIRCIEIAADSPISAVDMWLSSGDGAKVHRIAVGAPFFGSIEADTQVRFTPIRPLPLPSIGAYVAGNGSVVWDCTTQPDPALDFVLGQPGINIQIPVRLNVYRGMVPPYATKRAPYVGHVVGASGEVPGPAPLLPSISLTMITDGRKRVRVIAGTNAPAGGSLVVDGIEGYSSLCEPGFAVSDRRVDLPSTTNLAIQPLTNGAASSPVIVDYNPDTGGNPYFAISAVVQVTEANVMSYVQIHAWDD